jgi:hypothetical protein
MLSALEIAYFKFQFEIKDKPEVFDKKRFEEKHKEQLAQNLGMMVHRAEEASNGHFGHVKQNRVSHFFAGSLISPRFAQRPIVVG